MIDAAAAFAVLAAAVEWEAPGVTREQQAEAEAYADKVVLLWRVLRGQPVGVSRSADGFRFCTWVFVHDKPTNVHTGLQVVPRKAKHAVTCTKCIEWARQSARALFAARIVTPVDDNPAFAGDPRTRARLANLERALGLSSSV
jgi:hypothetical protein